MVDESERAPTPAPMADDDDDCATQVFRGQMLPPLPPIPESAPKSGVFDAPPSKPPVSMVVERLADAPIARDTLVDPPRSRWQRFKDGAARFSEQFMRDFLGTEPRLSPKLPPVPPLRKREATLVSPGVTPSAERGERMLLEIVLASPQYQHAAIEVARRALAIQEEGGEHYHDFTVHLALSRLRPDEQGRIAITRLRDLLPSLAFARELAPALIRLEEQGVVLLVLDTRGGDPMTEILRSNITHVELRVPV